MGKLTGDNSYLFEGYLESDYGYVFPGESDGLEINCAVNGGSFISWANESCEENKLYGLWLDSDDGYGTTPLWVTGTTVAQHAWDSEITKATPVDDGDMVTWCSGCNADTHEPISKPTEISLSSYSYVYDGTAKSPNVTVTDANGDVIDAANYDVSYEGNENAGSAKATVTFKGDYYEGFMDEDFTIEQKPITVTAKNASKVYGEKDPQLTATVSGLAAGDDPSLITYSLMRAEGENIGKYDIKATGDADQGNYQVSFVDGSFTIKGLPAVITASNKTVNIGNTVKIGAKANSGGAITYKSLNTTVAKVNATTGVVSPVNAGTATIAVSVAAKGNYTKATKNIKVTVKPGKQVITFNKQTKKLSFKNVKKAKQTIAIAKAKGIKTSATYSKVKVSKKAGNFTVNKQTGKITVKKGTPKGTYVLTMKVTASKSKNWDSANKTATIKIVIS